MWMSRKEDERGWHAQEQLKDPTSEDVEKNYSLFHSFHQQLYFYLQE